jgi:hypothetical protein
MGEIVIKESRLKLIGLFIIGLAATGGMVFVLLSGDMEDIVIKIIITIFPASGTVLFFFKLIKPKPVLIINEEGFTYDEIDYFVPWEWVVGIRIKTFSGRRRAKNTWIVVDLNEDIENEVADTKSEEVLKKIGEFLGFSGFHISVDLTKERPKKILAIMQEYWEYYKSNRTRKDKES